MPSGAHERLRLCSDVHDGLAQQLTGVALLLQSLRNRPPQDADRLQECLREIAAYVSHTIAAARALATDLSPLQVVGGSLASALMRLADDINSRLPVCVTVTPPALDDERIDCAMADNLYRITHEAVGNALRDSVCTRIAVSLSYDKSDLLLTIADNGSGLASSSALGDELGLRILHYRARVIGGHIRFEQPIGGGTQVAIDVPLPDRAPLHLSTSSASAAPRLAVTRTDHP